MHYRGRKQNGGFYQSETPRFRTDTEVVAEWRETRLSTGGGFTDEVGESKKYIQKLVEYLRPGRADLIPCEKFADDEEFLKNSNLLNSNDPHVLALARHTGTRLLYTGDFKLIQDFKNSKVINKPRGKVYSNSTNANLLTGVVCAKLRSSTPRN